MKKNHLAYPLLAVLFLQPSLTFAADKEGDSFFHRTRKTQSEKKPEMPELPAPAPVVAEKLKEETIRQVKTNGEALTEEEKENAVVPPKVERPAVTPVPKVPPVAMPPANPNKGYIMGAPLPKFPPAPAPPIPKIPSEPKMPPKVPVIPKSR